MALGRRIRRIKVPIFENVARAIGYVSIGWGQLEESINGLFAILVPLQNDEAGQAIVGNVDLRSKMKMISALAFIRKPNIEWFEVVTDALDYIDNDLRPRRNRVIHDVWNNIA